MQLNEWCSIVVFDYWRHDDKQSSFGIAVANVCDSLMTNHTQYISWVLATAVLGAQFQLQVPVYNHRAAGPHTLREFIRAGWYLQWTLSFQNRCGSKGRSLGDGGFSFVMGVPPQIIPVVMNDHDLVLKPWFFLETQYIYIYCSGNLLRILNAFFGGGILNQILEIWWNQGANRLVKATAFLKYGNWKLSINIYKYLSVNGNILINRMVSSIIYIPSGYLT